MTVEHYIGWDMGGAHLKMAHIDQAGVVRNVEQHATPIWQGLTSLDQVLTDLNRRLPVSNIMHVVTTTGELADIFSDRKQGVISLVDRIASTFPHHELRVYAGASGFITREQVAEHYQQVASANWHATAQFAAHHYNSGVLIDIGSSTTDIVPFLRGRLCNRGCTDQQRLQYDELVYSGIVRTPLMAIVDKVPFAGEWQSLAAEHFATTADIYRLTGELDETYDMMEPADGGGKMELDSARRLARMLGADLEPTASNAKWTGLARYISEQQLQLISRSLHRVISATELGDGLRLIGAGAGRFMVRKLAQRHACDYIDYAQVMHIGGNNRHGVADCATAVSVAQLARTLYHHEII